MEIFGADIDGIQGLLISFDGVLEEGSGVLLLGQRLPNPAETL